jgi:hypothetical protein
VKATDPGTEQIRLGNVTLEAVDRLTGMSSDEIERVAEQVLDGAQETAAVLRELARRVRENGLFANERLARFVRVANQCAEIAFSMQESVERRDEQPAPEAKKAPATAEHQLELTETDDPAEPDSVAQQIEGKIAQHVEGKIKSIRRRAAP